MQNALAYKELSEALGISINKMESKIGAAHGAIRKAIERKSAIKSDIVEKIVSAFPNVNKAWLIEGVPPVLINDTKPTANNNSNTEVSEPENVDYPTIGGRRKSVPLFDTEASAGQGNSIDLAPVTTPTQYIELGDLLRSDSQAALYIFGNSMTPSYPSGCIVGLRQNNDGIIQPGEVYVIEIESNRLLKRLYYNDDNTANGP